MNVFRNALLASIAAAAAVGSALASIPAVSVRIEQVGTGSLTLNPSAAAIEGGYGYTADLSLWGFQSNISLNSITAGNNNAFGGSFRIKNTTATVQQFIVEMTVTNDPFTGNSLAGGSVGGTLLGGPAGGLFSGVGSNPAWQAIINGSSGSATIASLLTGDPFQVTTAPNQASSIARQFFGNDPFIPSQPIGPLGTSRTIRMQFLLGAGSDVTLQTNFIVQVPAPGAIALLGASGLVARRRRRTA